jgi:hypothetical protein
MVDHHSSRNTDPWPNAAILLRASKLCQDLSTTSREQKVDRLDYKGLPEDKDFTNPDRLT